MDLVCFGSSIEVNSTNHFQTKRRKIWNCLKDDLPLVVFVKLAKVSKTWWGTCGKTMEMRHEEASIHNSYCYSNY